MNALAQHQDLFGKAVNFARSGCYWFLRTLGWVSVCFACVVALNVLFFVMLGNFTIEGLLYQLDNFGSRYLAADAVRRAEFGHTWLFANTLLLAIVCLFRRHALFTTSSTIKEA